ncbi:MAG TPA: fenitrothion hydrolase, partial [Solirubrobacteraceae bacterium]|nr:fenitrothion hydrolase [Solirubrobacteraceae bacterium]
WNLFGTATWSINYGVVGAEAFWYIQLGLVLAGHLAALVLAHDRALVVYDDARLATRSQYWMLAIMVGFTALALWLLSEASKG